MMVDSIASVFKSPFDSFSIHAADVGLFKALGLTPYQNVPVRTEFACGVARACGGRAQVGVFVAGAPAQFWRFVIDTTEGDRVEVKTGSGSFGEYWPVVCMIAAGRVKAGPAAAPAGVSDGVAETTLGVTGAVPTTDHTDCHCHGDRWDGLSPADLAYVATLGGEG